MRAVDANVLVRLLTRDDPKQLAAAEAFVAKGAWVSHLVLAETTWVLASVYSRDARSVATAVEMLLNHQHLTVQEAATATAALLEFRRRPSLSYSDCLIVEIARNAGHGPVGTFDRVLARIAGAVQLP